MPFSNSSFSPRPPATRSTPIPYTTLFRSKTGIDTRKPANGIISSISAVPFRVVGLFHHENGIGDRKSTRLNSSHLVISYAVFCLKQNKLLLRRARHPGEDWLSLI